jgi:two-component system, chemotaxis family, protein-glutamate methylesterase/glutaminase
VIRIVVAEDSPTARHLLVAMLESDPELTVVGEASNGRQAVEMVERLSPDLVTMDVEMPEVDGLAATQQIMMRRPTPIIVISSLARERAVSLSFEATRAGALLVLPKPESPAASRFEAQRAELVAMAKAMAAVKVVRRWGAPSPAGSPTRPEPARAAATMSRGIRLVAIAASTGGPAALRDVLGALPARFPVPVVVVQHIAPGFVNGLAAWLANETRHPVRLASDGEVARIGHVYIAPDDHHLQVLSNGFGPVRLSLVDAGAIGGFRPSATPMFESAAALGNELLACILTGMGSDGVTGLHAVHSAGGRVIAQDEATSVVWGMPREAVRAGLADEVLPLAQVGPRIAELAGRPVGRA